MPDEESLSTKSSSTPMSFTSRKGPVVLCPAEMARLLDAAPELKYKAALSAAYGAGLRALVAARPSTSSQQVEQARRKHDVTVLAALALLDTDDHPLAVDVGDLERDHLGVISAICAAAWQARLSWRVVIGWTGSPPGNSQPNGRKVSFAENVFPEFDGRQIKSGMVDYR